MAEVESSLVKQVADLLAGYKNVHRQLVEYQTPDTRQQTTEDELQLLEDLLEDVESQFVRSLKSLVPEVRALVKPSSDLSDLIKKYQESCFSAQNLEMSFKSIRATSDTVAKILKLAEVKNLPKREADDNDQVLRLVELEINPVSVLIL